MRLAAAFLVLVAIGSTQRGPAPEREGMRLPSGKSQRQEILKADHEKSRAEAGELLRLAQELKGELDDSEHQVLNLKLVRKAEDIERLARRIKNRMRKY